MKNLKKLLKALADPTNARVKEALAADSLEGRADQLRAAWNSISPSYDWYVCDVFDDAIIVRSESTEYRRVPYTVAGDTITFGEPTRVTVQYQNVVEAIVREGAELVKSLDLTGAKWDARIVRFGESKNKWTWTRESAASFLPLLEGAPVCLYPGAAHAPEATIAANGGPVKEYIVGQIHKPRLEADGIYGEIHIGEAQAPLRSQLLELAKQGAEAVGLSVDTLVGWIQEGTARVIKAVKRCISVDIVHAPSAGGALIRATAGPVLTTLEDPMREKLIALIKLHRPKLLEGRAAEAIAALKDEELEAMVAEALKPPATAAAVAQQQTVVVTPPPAAEPAWLAASRARECRALVREAVDATKLPDIVKQKIVKQFEGRAVAGDHMDAFAKEVEAAVKVEVETVAKLTEANPHAFGGRVEVGAERIDKLQAGMDRLFGVSREAFEAALGKGPFLRGDTVTRVKESLSPTAAAEKDRGLDFGGSLRRAYVEITGDVDINGHVNVRRAAESQASGDWPAILNNSLYRRLLMDYAEPLFNERSIAEYGSAVDFRTKEVPILDYFPDIATVDPESADYVEIAKLGDNKVSYAIVQRGNILTITRKTIINDDLRTVQKLVGRMGRAARRTLAKAIWVDFWVGNAAYDVDAVAWFNSAHGNTGSVALTADATGATEVMAKLTQLADMTEQGSGAKLGLPALDSLWLDVPHALLGLARTLNMTQYFGTTAANPVYQWFGAGSERINVNPLFTDVTDWGVHVAPMAGGRESLLVDFLQGREEPEFFLADNPAVGQAFVGDRIQYKLRHEYAVELLDFRGACKNVVAG